MQPKNAKPSLPPALGLPRKSRPPQPRRDPHPPSGRTAPPALLLACGNTLRQDDGVGLRIAEAAEHRFPSSQLRIVAAPQFTPEMATDLAATDLAIFVDACVGDEPGAIRVMLLRPGTEPPETHHLDPASLIALAQSLGGHAPAHAFALTIGASCFDFGEEISGPLRQAIPRALRLLESLVNTFAQDPKG